MARLAIPGHVFVQLLAHPQHHVVPKQFPHQAE